MPSRDIHSRDGGKKVRDFLGSLVANLLLAKPGDHPVYLMSPWLSDFLLFENEFGQYKDLFRHHSGFAERTKIMFSESLLEISNFARVRILTSQRSSIKFGNLFSETKGVEVKFKEDRSGIEHQKGFLSHLFYFEGSMNFTFSGLYRNNEKITCNPNYDSEGKRKIADAYLEFKRIWESVNSMPLTPDGN